MARRSLFEMADMSFAALTVRATGACTVRELCQSMGLSKPATSRLLARRQVTLADKPVRVDTHISAGQEVCVALEPPEPADAVSAGAALSSSAVRPVASRRPERAGDSQPRVLYRDRLLMAVDKPAGLLVHGDGTGAPTLTSWAQDELAHVAEEKGWPWMPSPQALQRLDVATSGIVLFSLAKEFQPTFDALVAGRALHKRYLAIVRGSMGQRPVTIDAPIARDRHDARRMRVGVTGKPAQTRVACMARAGGCSLVACELGTGRRHQIRVHLSHAGHPIVGDELYGTPQASGLMLHAYEVAFVHPLTGEAMALHTDWPARFSELFYPCEPDWSILNTM